MLLKPVLVPADIDYIAIAIALLPPLLLTPPSPCESAAPPGTPAAYFCAARLPLPQFTPPTNLPPTATPIARISSITNGYGVSHSTPAPALANDALEALLAVGVGDRVSYFCVNATPPPSPRESGHIPCTVPEKLEIAEYDACLQQSGEEEIPRFYGVREKRGGKRALTVKRVFSSQNGKLVLLGRISYPVHRSDGRHFADAGDFEGEHWREEDNLVVAKLRLSLDESDAWQEHRDETKILNIVSGSKWHGMFPRFIGIGEVQVPGGGSATTLESGLAHTRPILFMSYIPHPSITDILRNPLGLPCQDSLYNAGDKTVFHNDSVLHQGLELAVTALQVLGLRHGDLKGGNVVYRTGTGGLIIPSIEDRSGENEATRGRVWLVDMEGVSSVVLEVGGKDLLSRASRTDRDRRAVKETLSDFWKYELCCADGECRSGSSGTALGVAE